MIKYLIKSNNEVRVETMEDVEQFHKQLQKEAEDMGCTLASFSWTEKENKRLEEIYFQVKYTFVFNKITDPDTALKSITYTMCDGVSEEVPF